MTTLNLTMDYKTLSHELRIPLTGIIGVTELFDEEKLSHEQKKQIAIIRKAGIRLLATVEQILHSQVIDTQANSAAIKKSQIALH